jgi:ribosomal protein S18 acetylase RimI-like enzyme
MVAPVNSNSTGFIRHFLSPNRNILTFIDSYRTLASAKAVVSLTFSRYFQRLMANPESIQIRDAHAEDASIIAEYNAEMAIETENIRLDPEVVRRGVRAVFADESRGRYFVAAVDGKVAGQLLITHEWSDWRDGDIWWIMSVYVHPTYRRRGVFRALYDHVRLMAKEAGARGLRLYVEKENQAGQATYKNLGMDLTHYLVMEEMF